MSILSALFQALVYPSALLIHYYTYVILAAVILSWLEAFNVLNTYNSTVRLICDTIRRLTEPYFAIFRKIIPPVGVVDLSPLFGLIALYFLQGFVPALFSRLAQMTA
ncbi:MAG: YggT family protein [Alphaproteobacteria bacterium]